MFDSTKGRAASTKKLDGMTDRFAAEFEDRMSDLSMTQQEQLLEQLLAVMGDTDATSSFAAGTYAQDSSGAPAKALGSSGTVSDDDEALQVIMASSKVPAGVKAAILRIITPSDPGFIDVEADGTPKELVATRKERDNAKTAQKAAEDKLSEEQDENHAGSLAQQLKDAKAAPAPAADSVKKSDMKASLEDLKTDVEALKGKVGGNVTGKKELLEKLDKGIAKL